MTLKETIAALEAVRTEQYPEGITVAFNLGVHKYCQIDSNCPRAIQLRKIISDTGISLEELLAGFETSQQEVPEPVNINLPKIDGTLNIRIAEREFQLDLNSVVSDKLQIAINNKLNELERSKRTVEKAGQALYHHYLHEYHKLRDERTIPQVAFSQADILLNHCSITSDGRDYIYLFPLKYKPQYLVRSGVRYKMSSHDIERTQRAVFAEYTITVGREFYSTRLITATGDKFEHYHGTYYDCWGQVQIPPRWDGSLSSLRRLTDRLEASLATINVNSLMASQPQDMPSVSSLLDNSEELGREGVLEESQTLTDEHEGWGRRWGARR